MINPRRIFRADFDEKRLMVKSILSIFKREKEKVMNWHPYKVTALYCRVDSGQHSVMSAACAQNQQKRLAYYAKEHGLTNLQIFSDCGYNGSKTDRPAYQKLLEAIRTEQVSDVIVYDLSRLNRDFDNQRCILLEMKAHGVVLHSIRERRAGLISSVFSEYLIERKQK